MNPLRVLFKLALRRVSLIPSFCKRCGRDVHDFEAPAETWEAVEPIIPFGGHVVCYDCFCHLADRVGAPAVWRLSPLVP
jgi:hypothetical protein